MAKKSLGDTVLGWFVVREEEEGDAPAEERSEADEQLDADVEAMAEAELKKNPTAKAPPPRPAAPAGAAARPAAAAPAAPPVQLSGDVPQIAAGAAPDPAVFVKVYSAASISEEEQARVEKALSLLESLPKDTPKEVRRQIVEASLKAFGIPVDDIIGAAVHEIHALDAYIQQGEKHTQSLLQDANGQIEKLSAKILEIKKLMEMQLRTQQGVVQASNQQKLRIQQVLDFFGQEAVARVTSAQAR